jgi:hypothetical protein
MTSLPAFFSVFFLPLQARKQSSMQCRAISSSTELSRCGFAATMSFLVRSQALLSFRNFSAFAWSCWAMASTYSAAGIAKWWKSRGGFAVSTILSQEWNRRGSRIRKETCTLYNNERLVWVIIAMLISQKQFFRIFAYLLVSNDAFFVFWLKIQQRTTKKGLYISSQGS